jgi:NADPH-dependent 2,4-dienoyl-CoA reductase/sulfur reductase-like enzyme
LIGEPRTAWTAAARDDRLPHSMNTSPRIGLAAHEAAIRRDLDMLCLPAKPWLPPRQDGALDVLVVGAGMNGIAAAGALKLRGIDNIAMLDDSQPGQEGPWMTYAKMEMLREGDALRVTTPSNPTAKTPKASPETHFRQASPRISAKGFF